MEGCAMELALVSALRGKNLHCWQALLQSAGLTPEDAPEQTALLWDGEVLAAAGSRQGNVLKYLAVDPAYRGDGLLATVLTALRQEAFAQGHRHLFLYTKPENETMFLSLLFSPVASTDKVLLMEDRQDGIRHFLQSLPLDRDAKRVGAAVMNCDPFTRGHRYLIERAARDCDRLYVFVLSEDRGHFRAEDRLNMVRLGTADLKNVTVLPTGPYLISSATFPTYFLKDRDSALQVQCGLDIAVFAKHYAPHFGITHRYVGNEPLSAMTAQYNAALQAQLPQYGIAVHEMTRLETGDAPVSASAVRAALAAKDSDTVRSLVPQTTYDYLTKEALL